MNVRRQPLLFAIVLWSAWTLATWALEGRIATFLRPDAAVDRLLYALLANLVLGIVVGLLGVGFFVRTKDLSPGRAGLVPWRRTAFAVPAGFVLGLGLYLLQGAPTRDAVVMLNAFCQVFVVSAAEVVVCWCVVGALTDAALRRGRATAIGAGVVAFAVSPVLFGLYHFAHSPPFNTWPMVGLLTVVGVLTGAFFAVSRDLLGTIVFHNFLALFGVVSALVRAQAVAPLQQVQWPLVATALVTLAVLLVLRGRVVAAAADVRMLHP